MDRASSHKEQLDLAAAVAELKESLYKTTLGLTALIECLADKELITREEMVKKSKELELELFTEPEPGPPSLQNLQD